jgi:molybdopterin molybdotransferase
MLQVEEALQLILTNFSKLQSEERPLLDTLGQTLDEIITATFSIPPLENSGMDGYALRYEDIAHTTPENPTILEVIGEVAAGHLPEEEVTLGSAIRIMTGAPIPNGADTVIPFEDTDEIERKNMGKETNKIGIKICSQKRANIRPVGEDVKENEVILTDGIVLRPTEIGVLASIGKSTVKVIRRPKIAILATGDELLQPGSTIEPGKIFDSNSFSLAASVMKYGGIPHLLGIAPDNLKATIDKLNEGLDADLLITSAGVSKGDYDFIKDVLVQRGEIKFWSVRMRPAKPLAFGTLNARNGRKVPHIGLPGNPVSALVAFEQFCRPAILKMLGRTELNKPTITAILRGTITNYDKRRVYARVLVGKSGKHYYAVPTGPQGSNILTSFSRANGLAICPQDVPEIYDGQTVSVQMLDWPEQVEI